MFYLDDQFFSKDNLQARWQAFERNEVIKTSQRLAVCTDNMFEWLALLLFCQESGRSIGPIHPETPESAAVDKARQMGCDALVWQSGETTRPLKGGDARTGTLIQFSSGTTGEPKRVERSWDEISLEIRHYNRALALDAEVVPVVACPVTHSYGLICGVLATFARGNVPHIVTGWNPKFLIRILQRYAQPVLYSSPTFIQALVALWPKNKSLYGVMTSGSVMPAHWFVAVTQTAANIWQQYGCSEAGCVAIAKAPEAADVLGRPLGHCEIVAGAMGHAPEEVVIVQGGRRIHTRDLGYLDAKGNLRFCGRMDDTIVVAGYNVYPRDVEEVLMAHESIEEAVVFKKFDALAGERVAAIYTGKAALSDAEIRTWCAAHLARYQWPSWVGHVAAIPKLPNGKISRKKLTEQYSSVSTAPVRQEAV